MHIAFPYSLLRLSKRSSRGSAVPLTWIWPGSTQGLGRHSGLVVVIIAVVEIVGKAVMVMIVVIVVIMIMQARLRGFQRGSQSSIDAVPRIWQKQHAAHATSAISYLMLILIESYTSSFAVVFGNSLMRMRSRTKHSQSGRICPQAVCSSLDVISPD